MYNGSSDYLFTDVMQKEDNPSHVEFTGIFSIRGVLVYSKKRYPLLQFNSLEDLKGMLVGVMLGTDVIPRFEAAGLILDKIPNDEANPIKLGLGRIDFWASIDLTALEYLEKIYPERQSEFGQIEHSRSIVGLKMKKGSSQEPVFRNFQQGFAMIKKNRTYLKILEEFYGMGKVPKSVIME